MNSTVQKENEYLPPQTISIEKVHGSLSQQIVQIPEDRLRLIVLEHSNSAQEKASWIAPFGIFLSVILTLTTADFKANFAFSAEVMKSLFVMTAILSLAWFLWSWFKTTKSPSNEDLVEKIKNNS